MVGRHRPVPDGQGIFIPPLPPPSLTGGDVQCEGDLFVKTLMASWIFELAEYCEILYGDGTKSGFLKRVWGCFVGRKVSVSVFIIW